MQSTMITATTTITTTNSIIKQSLSLYRQILRNADKIVTLNKQNENRSRRVSDLIPENEIRDYVYSTAKKHFRYTQRQFYQGKLQNSDEILKRFLNAKWVNYGLECAIRDMTQPTHKRKSIKQSPHINILQTAISGHGNLQFHEELLDAFIVASKFHYHMTREKGIPADNKDKEPNEEDHKTN
jgi:hypothetical protein